MKYQLIHFDIRSSFNTMDLEKIHEGVTKKDCETEMFKILLKINDHNIDYEKSEAVKLCDKYMIPPPENSSDGFLKWLFYYHNSSEFRNQFDHVFHNNTEEKTTYYVYDNPNGITGYIVAPVTDINFPTGSKWVEPTTVYGWADRF